MNQRAKTNGEATAAVLRQHAERQFHAELEALASADDKPRPPNWMLSPWAVCTYLLGGKTRGVEITPKYIGNRRLIEIAIATLATDRARCCFSACPARRRRGCPSIWRRRSAATRLNWCRERREWPKNKFATVGTTHCCWQKARAARRSCPAP